MKILQHESYLNQLRREIRKEYFSNPLHPLLGIRVVDVSGIRLKIAILKSYNCNTHEFEILLRELYLVQYHDLLKLSATTSNKALVSEMLLEAEHFLWPNKQQTAVCAV